MCFNTNLLSHFLLIDFTVKIALTSCLNHESLTSSQVRLTLISFKPNAILHELIENNSLSNSNSSNDTTSILKPDPERM